MKRAFGITLRAAFAALFFFAIAACGGGGGASPDLPHNAPAGAPPRGEAWFGYYGDDATQLAETRGHVSMAWVSGWRDPQGRRQDEVIVERAIAACAAGKRVTLMMPADSVYLGDRFNPAAVPLLRGMLSGLGPARACVAALFPVDEPDLHGVGEAAIVEGNQALRAVLAEFPETATAKLAVIYSGADDFPGISSYDWAAVDDYRLRAGVLGDALGRLLAAMRADQRAFLVPGAADMRVGGRDEPGPFFARLQADPRIIGIVAFIFIDDADPGAGVGRGVRSNGTASAWCAAAVTITGGTC